MSERSLAPDEVRMLDLERRCWRTPGAKEAAMRSELDLDPSRYYQRLNQLLDREAALAHDPVTVGRLRELRRRRALTRRRWRA